MSYQFHQPFPRTSGDRQSDFTRDNQRTRDFDFEPLQSPTSDFGEITYRSLGTQSAPHPNAFQTQSGAGDASFGDGLDSLEMPSFPTFGGFGNPSMTNKLQQIQQHSQQPHVSSSLSSKLASIQMTSSQMSLKEKPVWIENHTSFVSAAEPPALLEAIEESMKSGPGTVDVVVKQEKGKMRGIVSLEGRYARFQIRLYSYQKSVVVEFQRREGDGLLVNNLFTGTMQKLGPEFVTRRYDNAPVAPPPPPIVLTLPVEFEQEPDQVLVSLENLLALCDSPCVDQQREAVSGLVTLSIDHGPIMAQAATTTNPRLLVTLIRLLASHNLIDIVRGSAVCLSNLLQAYSDMASPGGKGCSSGGKKRPTATHVNKMSLENLQALLASMLENLRSPALLESLDTKRHISKSLQSLAKAHPTLLAADNSCVNTLHKFKSSKDAVLRAHVLGTLQLIQSSA